jgi:3-dehydroquinate dehydratase-2
MKIHIINGPNLNLLGTREPHIYGNISFDSYFNSLNVLFANIELSYFQSNVEGEIITELQNVGFSYDGIILNAAGFTHTSVAIADAIASIKAPVIEVHISNIFAREEIRRTSLISSHCRGSISGFGLDGYRLGILSFIKPNE